jgi:Flp pilus assembly pilin Flp
MSLGSYIQSRSSEFTAIAGLLAVAIVANMPHPSSFGNNVWYAWLYNSLQAFLGTRQPRPPSPEVVAPQADTFQPSTRN